MPLNVLLADDHQLVRQGIRALLEREQFVVVGEASNGREAVDLAAQLKPDVAVLDLAMPLLNGVDCAREIRKLSPDTTMVLVTMHDEPAAALEALRVGVTGYVLKSKAAEHLINAIQEVSRGGVYLGSGVSRDVVQASVNGHALVTEHSLTPRERQVVQLVAEGKTNKEIATDLGVSVKTADSHRGHAMKKLGLQGTAALVRYAIRKGIVSP